MEKQKYNYPPNPPLTHEDFQKLLDDYVEKPEKPGKKKLKRKHRGWNKYTR